MAVWLEEAVAALSMLVLLASALVLGLAGYALQGHPGMPGAPHDTGEKPNIFAAALVDDHLMTVEHQLTERPRAPHIPPLIARRQS